MNENFAKTLDWIKAHPTFTAVSLALAAGLILGMVLAR